MKKILGRGLAILALTAGLAGGSLAASDVRFGFSFSGGMAHIDGGDFNRYIRDQNAWVTESNDYWGDESHTIDWKEMKWLPKFGGELTLRFGRYLGIGLGAEYIKKTNPGTFGYAYEDSFIDYFSTYYEVFSENYSSQTTVSQTLTVVPITLSLYGFLPIGSRAEAYVKIGGGYYLGKLKSETSDEAENVYGDINYWNNGTPYPPHFHMVLTGNGTETWEATCNAFGAHFGAGFNFEVSNNLALFAEAFYRMANFKEWTGSGAQDYTIRQTWGETNSIDPTNLPFSDTMSYHDNFNGQLWSYDDIWDSLRTGTYLQFGMYENGDEPEENDWTENVRPTEINLNGFAFKVGVRIFFGGGR